MKISLNMQKVSNEHPYSPKGLNKNNLHILSLSNLIAQQNLVTKKNRMAAELKDLMAEEGNNLKLICVPAHNEFWRPGHFHICKKNRGLGPRTNPALPHVYLFATKC
jgi:hypothetical protein